jgi:hypothetical protein
MASSACWGLFYPIPPAPRGSVIQKAAIMCGQRLDFLIENGVQIAVIRPTLWNGCLNDCGVNRRDEIARAPIGLTTARSKSELLADEDLLLPTRLSPKREQIYSIVAHHEHNRPGLPDRAGGSATPGVTPHGKRGRLFLMCRLCR